MPSSLKTYQNRCRCCLEMFADDEQPSPVTDFFELQFFAFTKVELKSHELLSKHVCEYCHSELVRFSVWKKDLIEKQTTLYKLLNKAKDPMELSDGEILNDATDTEDDDEYSSMADPDDISSTELEDLNESHEQNITSESEEPDEALLESEHEPDSDFEISKHHLRHHIISQTPSTSVSPSNSDLRCNICNTTFLARQGLVRHMVFCKVNKIAGKKINKRTQKKNAGKNAKYRCFCDDRFTSFRALNIHRTRKHGKQTNMSWDIVDSDDNVQAKSISPGNKGMSSKAKSKSPTKKFDHVYRCAYCSFKSEDRIGLDYHVKKNHEGNNNYKIIESLKCDECLKVFSTGTALRMHVITVHRDVRPHACLYCKSSFKQLVHLKEHMMAIHKTLHKPYCCMCGLSFSTLVALKNHKVQAHKGSDDDMSKSFKELVPPTKLSGKYICVCTREFTYPSRLLEHQKYCRYYKTQSESLIDRYDENEGKAFRCPRCGRAFQQKSNLIRHQKTVGHFDTSINNLEKYQCEHCKRTFSSQNGVRKHQTKSSCNGME